MAIKTSFVHRMQSKFRSKVIVDRDKKQGYSHPIDDIFDALCWALIANETVLFFRQNECLPHSDRLLNARHQTTAVDNVVSAHFYKSTGISESILICMNEI